MANVKILHSGGIGEYKQDDIVYDAHVGLVEIAKRAVRNAADGQLLAVLCDDEGNEVEDTEEAELEALRAEAKELGIKGNISAMKAETLQAKIAEARAAKAAEELVGLQEKANQLNVAGYEEMGAEQLKEAIAAAEEAAKYAGNQ